MTAIRYLERAAIDDAKWNACIDGATNGLIYCYTYYLDALASHWDGLVLDDYKAIMPLPWRKKWGVSYLYQPFAVAQSGLFGTALTAELLYGFLKKIPSRFRYWEFPLNFANRFPVPPFPLYERKNYVLRLNQSYESLSACYRPHIRRNLKKAAAQQCTVQKNIAVDIVIALAKKHAANEGTASDFIRFKNLFYFLAANGNAKVYAVFSAAGTVLTSAVFFVSHGRAYYILPGNNPAGKTAGASHLLLDAFIQEHAGHDLVLDFEGSDVPGLQFFYSSFGAMEEPYAAIRYNRLPWFVKGLKRS